MYIIRKYQEGLSLINDNSCESRILSPEEEEVGREVLPQLNDEKTAGAFVKHLLEYLQVTTRSEQVKQ